MYYVIEVNNVGPNSNDSMIDTGTIEIHAEPARANLSGEVVLRGWCGTTDDWSVRAHGEYETEEAARQAIAEIFGKVRHCDAAGEPFKSHYDGEEFVVAVFKRGEFAPMSASDSVQWAYDCIQIDIAADTTDERIETLLAGYVELARENGGELDGHALREAMRTRRDELREEVSEEGE